MDDSGELLEGRTFASDVIHLYTDEQHKEVCAMLGRDPVQGIAGFGASVHVALRDLADALIRNGVWIEVKTILGAR